MVLARGRLRVEFMPDEWEQTGAGAAEFVGRLPRILRSMLGRKTALPRVVVTDRGPGFYLTGCRNGQIVPKYHEALRGAGFRPFAGEDAAHQPPDCPDLLLHETAVGWIRKYFKKYPFRRAAGLEENVRRMKTCMAACVEHINRAYNVEELSSAWPRRLQELVAAEGERLKY